MSERKWTSSQLDAINAKGMRVLVSAAAGSGKTSVLTERVKNILTDTKNPCSVSEVLVVTFTRAAAGEMRDRINKALKDASQISPNSDYLRQQMLLLPTADISTIDSFCAKIVKDNFAKADISVDFTVLDDKELEEITDDAVNNVIDKLYEENDDSFIKLTSMFMGEKDDDTLATIIKRLYRFSRSYPSPEKYLTFVSQMFSADNEPNDTPWASYIYKYLHLFSDFHYKRLTKCAALIEDCGGFTPSYIERFIKTAENFKELLILCENKNWDGIVNKIKEGFIVAPYARNKDVNEYVKKLTSDVFDDTKKEVEKLNDLTLPLIFEHKEDCKLLMPIVNKLCEAVILLSRNLDETKKERNAYSFDDILHKCIDLLVEFTPNGWAPTPIANALREKYKEILIDEYQDTNQAQNIIFEAISRNCNNLYCVGDVKQSIYKFRLASPELFMSLKKTLPDYDGEKHPSQINLDRNFRSRLGVTQFSNCLFEAVMSEAVGEIDYNSKEFLVCGADYPVKSTPDAEILCLDYSDSYPIEALSRESEAVAAYIKNLLDSGVKVSEKNGQRPIESSDICILLRNVKNKANVYTDALKKLGIPSNAVLDGSISEYKEIQLISSFLKVINNPLLDIPLISVLFSPVFGFNSDELSEIRMINRSRELYPCLLKYAQTNDKAKHFIDKLNLYRNISVSYPVNEFVRFLIKDTDILNIYSAGADGDHRKNNIRGLIDFADKFSQNGRVGLGSFIRSLDSALESGKLQAYAGTGGAYGVQIMTIHKSKGLEFPYVIVADCSNSFNKRDSKNELRIARESGVGLKIRDDEKFTTYNTVSSVATEKDILFSSASEELRVLYVAATRAKEHITFVCPIVKRSGLESRVRLNKHFSFADGKLHPYAVFRANSPSEWLLSAFINHQDSKPIADLCGIENFSFNEYGFSIDVSTDIQRLTLESNSEEAEKGPVDFNLLNDIKSRIDYEYEYYCDGVLAKVTASSTENTKNKREFFAKKKPKFMSGEFTGADRGNAIHKFFEMCDFYNASVSPEYELTRLLNEEKLTKEEYDVIDISSVKAFFSSDIGKRILFSDNVMKEYEFSYLKKAGELYTEIPDHIKDEKIVVQGKLDLAFEEQDSIVLIDYKTDNMINEDKFREIYLPQINIYAESLKECTGKDVKERYIYSFKLNKFISL